jgi:hypothetical protein
MSGAGPITERLDEGGSAFGWLTEHQRDERVAFVESTAAALIDALAAPGWTVSEVGQVWAMGVDLAVSTGGRRPARPQQVGRTQTLRRREYWRCPSAC